MIFRWFDTKAVKEFADGLAQEMASQFPPEGFSDPRRKGSSRLQKVTDLISARASTFAKDRNLNTYQTAKLAMYFKANLRERGYSEQFLDSMTLELVKNLSKKDSSSAHHNTQESQATARLASELALAESNIQSEKFGDAAEIYLRLIKTYPDHSGLPFRLGSTYLLMSNFDLAIRYLSQAANLDDRHELTQVALGKAYLATSNFKDAQGCFRAAIHINKKNAEAHNCCGIALQFLNRPTEALQHFRKSTNLGGGAPAYTNLGMTQLKLGDTREAIANLRHAMKLDPLSATAASNYLFSLSHDDSATPGKTFAEHRRIGEKLEAPFHDRWPVHTNPKVENRRLRVGFISGDLNAHPVSNFVEPIWSALRNSSLEIWAYYAHGFQDEMTARLKQVTENWRQVELLNDDQLSSTIIEDKIDVLIDLSGHTANNRLPCFARKPAPVQASWIGNPNTTGLSAVDYYLADPYSAPPGLLDNQFTEKIVQLPSGPLFKPFSKAPAISPPPAFENGYLTFGTYSRPDKVSHATVSIWADTLRSIPTSRMRFIGYPDDARNNAIRRFFEKNGISGERISFFPRYEMSEYLSSHAMVDIVLDTMPFSGGTTTCHAAWMGVPTLTMPGMTLSSRSSTIVNLNIGLGDFVVQNREAFVARAGEIAIDFAFLADLRSQLRHRLTASALNNPNQVAAWFELAVRHMWTTWCQGKHPVSFRIDPTEMRAVHN